MAVRAQILCCEVDSILTRLLQDEAIMELLFSLLQQVRPCPPEGLCVRLHVRRAARLRGVPAASLREGSQALFDVWLITVAVRRLLPQSPPLECAAAGYFARVVGMLLFRRTDEVMAFLQASLGAVRCCPTQAEC